MIARTHRRGRGLATRLGTLLALAVALAALQASGSDPEPEPAGGQSSPYAEGLALAKAGKYAEARARFEQAEKATPDDPDVLNMLAYTQRKTDDLDAAFATYARALAARERFPQAREYLGEAHVQAAMEQLLLLKSYGTDGEGELAALVDALVAAAEKAKSLRPANARAATKW